MNVLHPPFVHFVVALPVAALFSQLTYLASRDKTYSKAAFRIMAFTLLVSFFALYSGMADAQKAIKSAEVISSGLKILNAHKNFGIILVIILFVTTLLKWLSVSKNSLMLEKISLLFIVITIAMSLYQGNHGGSLVYKYGIGVEKSQFVKQQVKNNP